MERPVWRAIEPDRRLKVTLRTRGEWLGDDIWSRRALAPVLIA